MPGTWLWGVDTASAASWRSGYTFVTSGQTASADVIGVYDRSGYKLSDVSAGQASVNNQCVTGVDHDQKPVVACNQYEQKPGVGINAATTTYTLKVFDGTTGQQRFSVDGRFDTSAVPAGSTANPHLVLGIINGGQLIGTISGAQQGKPMTVVGVDLQKGTERWRFETGKVNTWRFLEPDDTRAALVGETNEVTVFGATGPVVRIPLDPKREWSVDENDGVAITKSTIALFNRSTSINTTDPKVTGFDLSSGAQRWSMAAAEAAMVDDVTSTGVMTLLDRSIQAFDFDTGAAKWSLSADQVVSASISLTSAGQSYVVTKASREDAVLSATTGKQVWVGALQIPAGDPSYVLAGDQAWFLPPKNGASRTGVRVYAASVAKPFVGMTDAGDVPIPSGDAAVTSKTAAGNWRCDSVKRLVALRESGSFAMTDDDTYWTGLQTFSGLVPSALATMPSSGSWTEKGDEVTVTRESGGDLKAIISKDITSKALTFDELSGSSGVRCVPL